MNKLFSLTENDHQLLTNLTCLQKSMHDTIFCQFHIALKRLDFLRFKPTAWLNDSIIMSIIRIICSQSNNRFTCEESLITEQLLPMNKEKRKEKINNIYIRKVKNKENNIFSKDAMFFPLNIKDFHWFLIIVNFKKNTVCLLDSLPIDDLNRRKDYIDVILQYLTEFEIYEGLEHAN